MKSELIKNMEQDLREIARKFSLKMVADIEAKKAKGEPLTPTEILILGVKETNS